jgi:hypothetical protein
VAGVLWLRLDGRGEVTGDEIVGRVEIVVEARDEIADKVEVIEIGGRMDKLEVLLLEVQKPIEPVDDLCGACVIPGRPLVVPPDQPRVISLIPAHVIPICYGPLKGGHLSAIVGSRRHVVLVVLHPWPDPLPLRLNGGVNGIVRAEVAQHLLAVLAVFAEVAYQLIISSAFDRFVSEKRHISLPPTSEVSTRLFYRLW